MHGRGSNHRTGLFIGLCGPANIQLCCEALLGNRSLLKDVLHGMQQQTLSIEQGLQQLSDIVITCAKHMPRSCLAQATP
jgi:hypothetical protein